jgi:hypothetical protein
MFIRKQYRDTTLKKFTWGKIGNKKFILAQDVLQQFYL